MLERAAVLFGTHGFQGVGIAALADDLGVSKAALFHYFRSKREIYDAIVLDALQGLDASVSSAVSEDDDAPTQLLSFMRAHAEFFEENYWKFVVMLVGFGGISPPFVEEVMDIRDRYEARLRRIISEGVRDGSFSPVDPSTTARAVLSMLNWMVRWFKPGGKQPATDLAAEYGALILAGISAPAPAQARPEAPQKA
jgi:AcrR family transcriptional regulator